MQHIDKQFANCFSVTILERYCNPDNMLSKRLEADKNAFFGRNPTKYFHHALVGLNTAADFTERIPAAIFDISSYFVNSGKILDKSGAAIAINIGISLLKCWKDLAPEIKKKTAVEIRKLNSLIILYRLQEVRETFLWASEATQQAMTKLARQGDNVDPNLVATLINSFGPLMQSLVPLFETTLYITDADFTTVAAYSGAAALSIAAWVGLSMFPIVGPLGLVASVGVGGATGWTVVGSIDQGIEWGRKRDSDPSITLLMMLKNMEENLNYLRALGSAGRTFKSVAHERTNRQLEIVSTTKPYTPKQRKAYIKNQEEELEKNLKALDLGLFHCEWDLMQRTEKERAAAAARKKK
ncbi:hypothetical protein KCU77_g132, partial [Aureobasidium melanogenum]